MHHMRCEVDRWRPIRFMIIAMFQAGSNPKLTIRPFSSRTLALAQLFKHQSIGGAESLHVSLQTLRPHSWGGVWGTQSQSMMYWQMTLTWRFTFCHLLFKSWLVFYHVCQRYQNVEIELMLCISRDIYPAKMVGSKAVSAVWFQSFHFAVMAFQLNPFPSSFGNCSRWRLGINLANREPIVGRKLSNSEAVSGFVSTYWDAFGKMEGVMPGAFLTFVAIRFTGACPSTAGDHFGQGPGLPSGTM